MPLNPFLSYIGILDLQGLPTIFKHKILDLKIHCYYKNLETTQLKASFKLVGYIKNFSNIQINESIKI